MSISAIAADYKSIEKPKYAVECVDEFSLDKNANLELGRSEAKYIYKEMIGKNVRIDMLKGMDEQVGKRRNESLDKIFHWLMEKAAPNSILKEALDGCDFVCRRGPLSRIAASPYSKSGDFDEGQRIICTKYKGIYFMREFGDKTEEEKNEKMGEFQLKMCYLGRKFEQIMTSNDPNKAPNADEVVDPNAEFNGMFKATLTTKNRPLNILCSAEIDGILKGVGEKDEFVELKTQIRRMGHGRNFINKAVKWYFQSHLIGIKRFVVGYHDNFIMNKVDFFTLDQLMEICGGRQCPWNVEICLNFLHAFLEKIKTELDAIPEGTILVVERPKFGHEFHFTPIEKGNEDYEKYKVISEEFNAHGWKEENEEEE